MSSRTIAQSSATSGSVDGFGIAVTSNGVSTPNAGAGPQVRSSGQR